MLIHLDELLARRELGLRLVAGDPGGEQVLIHAVEICDLPDPRPWLNAGSMLLTTGVALGFGAQRQRLLVERSADARVAAIGFSVGLAHADVPEPVRDCCDQLALPLVAVPAATPFRLLAAAVEGRDSPRRLQETQRALSVHTYLMEALAAPEPEAELLRRLGSLITGTAVIVTEAGDVHGAPNAAIPRELWGPLRGSKGLRLHHLRGLRYLTTPISDRADSRRWLMVVGDPRALPDELARQAMHAAERLARLIDRARPPRPAEARAVRAELLGALLGWRAAGNRRQHAHRAATLGLGVEAPLQVTVARAAAPDSLALAERLQVLARAQAELEMRLTTAAVPFLLGTNDADLVMVAPDDATDVLRTTLAELAHTGAPFRAGIGRGVPTLDELPRSYLDARFAVEQLGDSDEIPTTTAILAYDELDFATSLLCDADPEMLQARRSVLKDMTLDAALRETLLAYLANQLDVRRTASALHLHPNSLRYRLARIEERLGRTLADPATITDLYLATRVDRANGSR